MSSRKSNVAPKKTINKPVKNNMDDTSDEEKELPKKVVKKIDVMLDDSDSDSESDSNSDSDSDSDNKSNSDSESESDNDNDEKKEEEKKVVKKLDFAELHQEKMILRTKMDELNKKEREHVNELAKITKEYKQYDRELRKLEKQELSVHQNDQKLALKNKKKKRGNTNSGINKEGPVPKTLYTYFNDDPVPESFKNFVDISQDELKISRPMVGSILNDKYVALGLKEGQVTFLDEENMKKLGVNESVIKNLGLTQTKLNTYFCSAKNMNGLNLGEKDIQVIKSKNDKILGCILDAKYYKKLFTADKNIKDKFRELTNGCMIGFTQAQTFIAMYYKTLES